MTVAKMLLTEARDGATQNPKHRRLGIRHLTLDRKLSLEVNCTEPATNNSDENRRKEESWGIKDHNTQFSDHADSEVSCISST
jgi:hypothetical protein